MDPVGLESHDSSLGGPVEGAARLCPKNDLTLVDHEHHGHDCGKSASAYRDMAQSAADQQAEAIDRAQHIGRRLKGIHADDDRPRPALPAGPKVLSSVL
jgi:hypothetical protein